MTLYRSICGNTGVYSYEIGSDYIDIRFKETPQIFRYSYLSAGKENVEKMMELAENGYGLYSFINMYVKDLSVKL